MYVTHCKYIEIQYLNLNPFILYCYGHSKASSLLCPHKECYFFFQELLMTEGNSSTYHQTN